jgi:TrmH family RNA methyltransferase
MGAIFRQRTVRVKDLASTVLELKASGRTVLSAALSENSVSLFDTEITEDTVFIVGNEGNGIRDEVLKASGCSVIIPMENGTESLNAAAAATILLYEQYKAGR